MRTKLLLNSRFDGMTIVLVSGILLSHSTDNKILINQGKTLRTLYPWGLGDPKRYRIRPENPSVRQTKSVRHVLLENRAPTFLSLDRIP